MGIIHGRLDLYWLPDLSTSIGDYNHVVGSFSATDKGSALSLAADADDSMEHAEATVLTPKSSVRAPGGSGEGETSMFTTPGDIPCLQDWSGKDQRP